jgi:hypothetical protein
MKKIIAFSVPAEMRDEVISRQTVREFADGSGFEVDQVIFSTAYNRNKCFFQVSKLLGYSNKLSKLLFDLNHDLAQTGGEYVAYQQAGYTKIWSEMNGENLEVHGTFRSTSPYFIAIKDKINAPSVELLVDESTAIINENGEYYDQFEWVGTAQLTGQMAGSGDARNISEIREFNLDLTPKEHKQFNNNIMQEEQVKALLDEQKETLTKDFTTQLEGIKKEFSEVVSQSQSQNQSVWEWTDTETGNTYRQTYKEVRQSLTELMSGEVPATEEDMNSNVIIQAMKAKGFQIVAPTETPEQGEKEEGDEVDEATKQVNNAAKVFSNKESTESQLDPEEGAKGDVSNTIPSFYSKSLIN